jgi:soluble lytic murein transglycosylase-like protein
MMRLTRSGLSKEFGKVIKFSLLFSPIVAASLLIHHLAFAFIERRYPAIESAGLFTPLIEVNPKLLNALIMVESSNNPKAMNRYTKARGLTQITPIAWKELVRHHGSKYKALTYKKDIFTPEVARQAGEDYLYIIQLHLKAKKIPVTLDNVLAAYVWGHDNLKRHGLENAPRVVKKYIRDIKRLAHINPS